jgi:hypothetical protein
MSRLERVEQEIKRMTPDELAAFRDWYTRFDTDEWDRRIEADALAGRLDALAEKALADHRAGKSREL